MRPLLYLVRHGETAWNAEFRLQGQSDTKMTARGRAQARRNGRRLAGLIDDPEAFDFVASPLSRTRETMELIRAAMHLPAAGYELEPRLIEVHFGDWQGFTLEEIEARTPGSTGARLRDKWGFLPPGAQAESYGMLLERVRPWLEALPRPTVAVAHGGVLRAVFRMVGGMPAPEAAALDICQDRVLRVEGDRLEWL
jgi:broad specificity phosphatase PhoE